MTPFSNPRFFSSSDMKTCNLECGIPFSELRRILWASGRQHIRPPQCSPLRWNPVLGADEVSGSWLAWTHSYRAGNAWVLQCLSHLRQGHQHDCGRVHSCKEDNKLPHPVAFQPILDHQQDISSAAVQSWEHQYETSGRLQGYYLVLLQEEEPLKQEQGKKHTWRAADQAICDDIQ